MKKIITIDAGTSNLRLRVLEKDKIIFEKKSNIGVRIGKKKFKEEFYNFFRECMEELNLKKENIKSIIASGMISSPLGLEEVKHLLTPVSIKELSLNIKKIKFYEYEILLITGVKVEKDYFSDSLKCFDVMRGEETEVFGILDKVGIKGDKLIIMPGSHNKFIEVQEDRIVNFTTTISGELYDVLTKNTLLSSSLEGQYADIVDNNFLIRGYEIGSKYGVNQGAFILREIDLSQKLTLNEKANFLLGVIISGDIEVLKAQNYFRKYKKIIIAGNNIISKSIYHILKNLQLDNNINIIMEESFSTWGALKILKNRG